MFLSSHQLEDVEMVCGRASIIHKGKLQVMGTMDELLGGERVEVTIVNPSAELTGKLGSLEGNQFGEKLTVTVPNTDVGGLLDSIRSAKGDIFSVIPKKRRLEDLFVEIVGERIDATTGSLASTGDRPLDPSEAKPSANKYKDLMNK